MTSTSTGLPDRYRPIDRISPDEPTATGVIRSWRARDKVLNRDVAVRIHTPGGQAAREWITRALTAGGLATPALAMVYDAAESSSGIDGTPGAAYVVNEWLEGPTLAERLERGPLSERDARNLVRRLAEGVGEAHRVGLAVGGLTPEHVVLRPGGLVGLLAVPAATGSVPGDIAALGSLLEAGLTGHWPGSAPSDQLPTIDQPDLAALVRRARSTEPGAGLSSAAAMVALLGERRPTGHTSPLPSVKPEDTTDSGWLRRLRDRRDLADADAADEAHRRAAEEAAAAQQAAAQVGGVGPTAEDPEATSAAGFAPIRLEPAPRVPVPTRRPDGDAGGLLPWGPADDRLPEDRLLDDRLLDDRLLDDRLLDDGLLDDDVDDVPDTHARRRLAVVGLPLLALAVVIGLAWWVGQNVITAAGSVQDTGSSVPSTAAASSSSAAPAPAPEPTGGPLPVAGAAVYDPGGDGQPENDGEVPLSYDGDPATSWTTLSYSGSPQFGNLKDGVGVMYDLGSPQALGSVTITTDQPGATVEIRTADAADPAFDSTTSVATATLAGTDVLTPTAPVTTRYVLVWVTGLVPDGDGFDADLAEVSVQAAG